MLGRLFPLGIVSLDTRMLVKSANNNHNLLVYQFIRQHGGWSNWNMVEIERVTFTEKPELLKRERFHIEAFKAELNVNSNRC